MLPLAVHTPLPPPACSAGILAGGAGTRFGGQDKGWIEWRGRPLIEWTLEAVRPQAREVLVSANRNVDRYRALGVTVVSDPCTGQERFDGPLAGLLSLLEAARQDWLLCVPCDAVQVPADLAQRFAAAASAGQADIAVLADGQGLHPTFCFVRTALAADARRCFEDGERAPRRWFERHRIARLEAPAPINLNTPEGLRALELRP